MSFAFAAKLTRSYEISLWVYDYQEDQTSDIVVWGALLSDDDRRYFEASIDEPVWSLLDMAVHCYDE
jgi:hypothetical protein